MRIRLLLLAMLLFTLPTGISHGQTSCEEIPPPLNAEFVQSMAEYFWDKTDFCVFHEGVWNEIFPGGPPPDGIPPIDSPIFDDVTAAQSWLPEQSPVIVVEIEGDARAYPLAVLTRHEIANDTIGEIPIAVTFCPLCNSAITYDRRFDGETIRLGVSGLLRNSDMIMWDDISQTWWQQFTGEGIVGKHTGRLLDIVPSQVVSFGVFALEFPQGKVLSGDSGMPNFQGTYNRNPYEGYDSSGGRPALFAGQLDLRLDAVERVLGAAIDGTAVAYPFEALAQQRVINDTINAVDVVAFWQPGVVSALDQAVIADSRDVGMAALFNRSAAGQTLTFSSRDGQIIDHQTGSVWNVFGRAVEGSLAGTQLDQINAFPHFWFAWAAFFPETTIFGFDESGAGSAFARYELDPVLGSPDAPVTIIEYGAYACPSCKALHEAGIIEDLLAEYDGKVRFIFRDFPVISPNYDRMAANLAQCALDQGNDLFWAFHDALYTVARQGASSQEDLIEMGRLSGLNADALRACAEANTHALTVEYDYNRGIGLGLRGTPSLFINDQPLFAPDAALMRAMIDEALAQSGN